MTTLFNSMVKAISRVVLPRNVRRRLRMVLFLIGKRNRKRLAFQLGLNAGLGLMEVLSIVSVFPFLAVAARPDLIESNEYLNWAYTTLGFETERAFLVFLGLALLGILVATTVAKVLVTWANTKFLSGLLYHLTVALTRNYLRQPYPFFLGMHTSTLHSRILQDVAHVGSSVFTPTFTVCAKSISAGLVFAALLAANPGAAVAVIAVLGGGYGLIYKFLKPRLTWIGEEMRENDRAKMRSVHECFSGIKVAKVMGLEDPLLRRVDKFAGKAARLRVTNNLQQMLPVQAMEVAVFALIVLGTLYMVAAFENFTDAIPVLGLYAFAAYKLKPGLQAIYQSSTQIKKGLPRVDAVYEHLLLAPPRRARLPRLPESAHGVEKVAPEHLPIIEFRNVQFQYTTAPHPTLEDINFSIPRDTTVGIRGPTGSGKTTLLDLILGLLTPNEGDIIVDGRPLEVDRDVRAWQRRVGYVPQEIYLTDGTVAENIAYGLTAREIDEEAVRRAASMAQIAHFVETELPEGYQTKVGERGVRLSGGQRQRIGIARALYYNPDVLVFDEATSALDNETEAAVMQAVSALSHRLTIIMVAHRLSTLECCDEVHRLEAGRLVETRTLERQGA